MAEGRHFPLELIELLCQNTKKDDIKEAYSHLVEYNQKDEKKFKESAKRLKTALDTHKIHLSKDQTDLLTTMVGDKATVVNQKQPGVTELNVEVKPKKAPDEGVDVPLENSGAKIPQQQQTSGHLDISDKSKTYSGPAASSEFHGKLIEGASKERDELLAKLANMEKKYNDEKKNYENHELKHSKAKAIWKNIENEQKIEIEKLNRTLGEANDSCNKLQDECVKLDAQCRQFHKQVKAAEDRERKKASDDLRKYQELRKEHEDLKNRFSKQAASKLADGNPDITDLSDPNRAMKLAETFSNLYDDSWTDAYSNLTDNAKKSSQEATQYLLNVLNECYAFCQQTEATQMDSLKNVLLHPIQDPEQFVAGAAGKGGLKQPRIASKEEQSLRTLRRSVGMKTTDVVKQLFLKMQDKMKQSEDDRKTMVASMPFYEKCAEICWNMVLHDPPVRMVMEAKKGDKININLYSKLSASGDKIDYLVWPPLAIAGSEGLLSKGVVQPDGKGKKK